MRSTLSRMIGLGIVAAMAAAGSARAQTWQNLQVVEPGVGDLGPVGISTRVLPQDLRQPSGFDRVYRVPGSSRGVRGYAPSEMGERLARVDGAITMVFPRSEYVETKKGVRAVVPAGTVYYIGHSPLLDLPDTGGMGTREHSVNAVSMAYGGQVATRAGAEPVRMGAEPADLRVHPGEESTLGEAVRPLRPDAPMPAANVFTDEQFRRTRIRALLMSAVRGE